MSYSFSGTAVDGGITGWTETPQQDYGEAESLVDLRHAQRLAQNIATLLGGSVTISGGGHSNPNRTPADGWATDQMSISVTRAAPVAAAPAPAPEVSDGLT